MSLRSLLEQATREMPSDPMRPEVVEICQADARLIALCPETTAWVIDVGELLQDAIEDGHLTSTRRSQFRTALARLADLEQKAGL